MVFTNVTHFTDKNSGKLSTFGGDNSQLTSTTSQGPTCLNSILPLQLLKFFSPHSQRLLVPLLFCPLIKLGVGKIRFFHCFQEKPMELGQTST
mmetsp:Transcript_41342/g.107057  ORF Transcript_41342/g.107057 Transcript_41342/m.107057 type:complete len:93 (+) Transcript_41342:1070-1348(+)